jgi:hypothetical protein
MKKHIKYPKTGQFREMVANVNRLVTFTGLDDNGDAIYDPSIPKPTLTFNGSVKLHGTNGGVSYNGQNGLWAQSRNGIITPERDNAGFAFFVKKNEDYFIELMAEIIARYEIDVNEFTISIYGEWAGKGILKNVGISEIDKAFFIFGVKISKPQDPEFVSYWVDSSELRFKDQRIFNVEDYETYSIDVDFNMPQLVQNKFAEITEAVEKECPIAKAFGIENGVGEGVVWTVNYKGARHVFKVKGQKHSVSKVKKLASVDVEKLDSIKEFVTYAVTKNRFDQGIDEIFKGNPLDIKKMGDFLRWIINDIMSEEIDTMVENNLKPKDVNKYISTKAREMFFAVYNKI